MPAATYIVEWKPAGSWVDISAHIEAVDGDWNLSGNKDNALSFGDASELRCTVKTVNLTLQSTAYLDVPIRITFAMDAATGYAFWGVISKRDRDQTSLTFSCEGYARLIARTRVYTESRFRRPVATVTTAASVEDPTDGSYVAGLINETLWEAGGRPLEQAASYPTALFYYSVPETAILAPEWSWLAGEDAWGECLRLAQAAGGQIFQDADGVVQYLQPLSFGEGSASFLFDEDVWGDLTEQGSGELVVTKVVCPYIPRVAQALQEVINDTTPRLVNAGETVAIVLEAQNPLKSILTTGGGLPDGAIKATFLDGRVVAATDFTQAAVLHGQRVTLTVENTSAYPFAIDALVIQGEPIVAGEAGVVTVGSGDVALTVQDNPYVQSQAHAERLATMILAFHGSTLPLRSATDLVYDPDRSVGETIELTCSRWSLSAVPHLIVAKQHSETGIVAGYDLVPVAGLPKSSDFFIVGATSYTGLTRKLGF